ncbi:uncharacterized protein LOC144647310 [Oculina patagonica]
MKAHLFLRLLTVASFLFLVSRMSRVKAAGQCGSQSSSYGKALKGHTFDKVKVPLPGDCLIRCENDPRCQSLNYVMEDNICELNNRSKEARPADYVTDPSRIYMSNNFKRVPIGSIRDLPAESCEEIKASEEEEVVSGNYWLDRHSTGEPTLIHCYLNMTVATTSSYLWPSGTYGLPRSKLGCPQSYSSDWKTGWRYQDTENSSPKNAFSDGFHMDAMIWKDNMNKSFCIKVKDNPVENEGMWPKGQYCIYKKGDCPKLLNEGLIFWDDEDSNNQNTVGGTLPDGIYNHDTSISFCCRTDGDKSDPMVLPVSKPFYLLAYGSSECQQVKEAFVTEEFIQYDNEDTNNKDTWSGAHPNIRDGDATTSRIITYCYYQTPSTATAVSTCSNLLEKTTVSSGVIRSNYKSQYSPNAHCQWTLSVSINATLELVFRKLSTEESRDVIHVYDGESTSSPLIGSYSGTFVPGAVNSSSNQLLVIFTSDSSNESSDERFVSFVVASSCKDVRLA